jgi:hypothetical protein
VFALPIGPCGGHAQSVAELATIFPRIVATGAAVSEMAASDGDGPLELDLVPVYAIPAIPILVIARIIEPEPLVRDVRLYFDPDSLGLTAQSPAATASLQTRCNMLHNNDIDGTSVSWTSQLDRVPP